MKIIMNTDKDFHQKLTLLKIYYGCVLDLLENFCKGYLLHIDEHTNKVYLTFINKIESILNDERFSELAKEYQRPFKNLLGSEAQEADVLWEDGSVGGQCRDFYAEIQELFVKLNKEPLPIQSFPNSAEIKTDTETLNEIVKTLKERNKEDEKILEKSMEKFKGKIQEAISDKQREEEIKQIDKKVTFDDEKATIEIGEQKCPLPPYKNEHYFCRAAFEHPVNEPVDWSIIYERMTGYYEAYYGKPPVIRRNWRSVYDTMRAVNERIKEVINTNDNLFTWQEKTLKRNY